MLQCIILNVEKVFHNLRIKFFPFLFNTKAVSLLLILRYIRNCFREFEIFLHIYRYIIISNSEWPSIPLVTSSPFCNAACKKGTSLLGFLEIP